MVEVVSPVGAKAPGPSWSPAAPVPDLAGRTVAQLWDYIYRGEVMFDVIRTDLAARHPGIRFVGYDEFGNIHGPTERDVVDALAGRLKEFGCDVAIVGVGACGSCAPAVLRASLAAERAGVPAVSILAEGHVPQAEALEPMYGVRRARKAVYRGLILNDTEKDLRAKVSADIVPSIEAELARALELADDGAAADPERPVLRGPKASVREQILANGWTDGLPVVLPTADRVREFLAHTPLDPHESLGVMPPAEHVATPWNVAVNGVMAGCRPEYMPVLVAIVQAVSAPEFRVRDAGATPGWEPLVTLSGPLVEELGFNSGQGVLRVGNQANTSVGRFVRLYLRNVAGFRPGGTDNATFAYTFNCVLAENDEATRGIGWDPYRVDQGFGLDDTVVTVQSVISFSAPVLSTGEPWNHVAQIGASFRDACRYWYARLGVHYATWFPLVVLSPSVARVIAGGGISKADIGAYLARGVFGPDGERLSLRADEAERILSAGLSRPVRVADYVASGLLPASFVADDAGDRPIPLLISPDDLQVVVAGDTFRNQSKVFVPNHQQGIPVSRAVVPRR